MKRMADEVYDENEDYDYDDYNYDNEIGEEDIDYSGFGINTTLTDTGMPTDVEEPTQQQNKLKEYTAHNYSDIEGTTNAYTNEVRELLKLNSSDAKILLRHYKWDKEKLTEDYFVDPDRITASAGIIFETNNKAPEDIDCTVCLETAPPKNQYSLNCCHKYCISCWASYITDKFLGGKTCLNTKCIRKDCKAACGTDTFERFLSPANFNKFQQFDLESFVDYCPLRKWCPAPECRGFVETGTADFEAPVQCKCGFRFCFKCADFEIGDHAPAACEDVEKWMKKAADESENVKWMQANTKRCPKCNSHIEKNGGCMHMTCRKCTHEFCWLCRKAWRGHNACNKNESVIAEEKSAERAKSELEKYMFYFHRYESHRNAMKIADNQRKSAKQKGEAIMQALGVRAQDIKFISEATEQLLRNRNMLQYSYVYGYYLSYKRVRTEEKTLFEYLQQNLEQHTDKLSGLYEQQLDSDDLQAFTRWRDDVVSKTRVSKKFLDNFIEGVILKTLTTPEGDMLTEDERFYHTQLEQLQNMGLPRDLTLPLLIQFDGNVNRVVAEIFKS